MTALRDELALAIVGGAAVYLGALALFERFVFPEDARVVIDVLRRRA